MTISESGMTFGPYDESKVYHLEVSNLYREISNAKTVEFLLCIRSNELSFIEAKSSSPKPEPKNNVDFENFISEIRDKFLHSLNLYYSAIQKRHKENNDIPPAFSDLDNETISINLILVIKGHQQEWLPPISDALSRALIPYASIWHFNIAVINDLIAMKHGLITATT